jgi:hypothetical protein
MSYIRTKQNIYGINVVIDISTDENFVRTSGLEWTEISSGSPAIGDYYYNNQFINIDSDNYSIIRDLIHAQEEPHKEAREKEEARKLAELQAQIDAAAGSAPTPAEVPDQTVNLTDLPRPVASASLYADIESTQELYDHWTAANANLKVTINALENGSPTVDNTAKTVTFSTPVEFPDGVTQSTFRYHVDEDFSDYLQYLKDTDGHQSDMIVRMRTDLGISTT